MAWTTFAFGGIYPATLIPAAAACLVLAAVRPPGLARRRATRLVDGSLLLVLLACGLQAVPLPRVLVAGVSPAALAVERAYALVPPSGPRPLSIRPEDTVWAWLLAGGTVLLFLGARRAFAQGGVRRFTRITALTGLVLAGIALAQDATAKGLMYWRVAPPREGPFPFGPFTNRNHFGTWAMMVVPLCIGYLAAHAAAHPGAGGIGWRRRLLSAMDARAWLLIAASMLLMVATAASLSRSGIAGMAVSVAAAALLMQIPRRRSGTEHSATRRASTYGVVAMGAATAGILTLVGPLRIVGRFGAAGTAVADRAAIWQDTLPLVRDFWLAGTGAGTFQTAMAVYQRSRLEVIYNQAHNHYLQLAAEGGLLMGVPVALALLALLDAGRRCLASDRSPVYFLRAGAAAGLIGVATQSVWETGLTVPANAALAAVLAALLLHAPQPRGQAGR